MNGKLRVQADTAVAKESKKSHDKVVMLKNTAVTRKAAIPSSGIEHERKKPVAEAVRLIEQTHREELERMHLQYAERIRQIESARLEGERKLEEQQDFHARLAEKYQAEAEQRKSELLTTKDLLRKASEEAAALDKRVTLIEAQRETLESERRTLHEALQSLRKDHASQVKTSGQLQAQRDALEKERQSLQETVKTLQGQLATQVNAATRLQAQRDALVIERRTLQETLQLFRGQHFAPGSIITAGMTGHGAKPLCNPVTAKVQPVTEPKAAGLTKGVLLPAGLDAIPLPVGRNSMTLEEKTLLEERLDSAMKAGGLPVLEALVDKQIAGRSAQLGSFCRLKAASVALAKGYVDDAIRLADGALKNDSGVATVQGAANVYYDAAALDKAHELVDRLESMQETVGAGDRRLIDEVRGQAQLVAWAKEPVSPRSLPVIKGRVLNVLAFSLPYSSVGYAIRSHGLAIGIKNAGWDIRPYTRPCFPYDSKPEFEGQALQEQNEIDGITYRRIFDYDRKGMNEVKYIHAAIASLTRVIEREQPEVVHAASNYVTAFPAMIAARRLGVPFLYEMRGFWEVTRSSRDEAFENTPKYRFMQLFDGLVATQADHVITITTAMKEELLARGVPESKIAIAFNSVDPARFMPRPRNTVLAEKLGIPDGVAVIGYVGSFVDYEGLDDLITAAAGLKQAGREFRLLLVGDGAVFDSIRAQVQSLSLDDKVILTGRVPHEEVEDYYSLVDIAPFPRKPWKVCELVSPLKPFEAMALEKVVVVSGTRALKEIVDHERNGLVFEKGNVQALQQVLDGLVTSPEKRRQLGHTAREWVIRERSWDVAGSVCSACYGKIVMGGARS